MWVILIGAIGGSIIGNGAHAAGGNPVHVAGAAVPAVALAASLHLLTVLVRHVVPDNQDTKKGVSQVMPMGTTTPARKRRAQSTRDRAAALIARNGVAIDADVVASKLDISRRHAARLLSELRPLHVLNEDGQHAVVGDGKEAAH